MSDKETKKPKSPSKAKFKPELIVEEESKHEKEADLQKNLLIKSDSQDL